MQAFFSRTPFYYFRFGIPCMLFFFFSQPLYAHVVVGELEKMSAADVGFAYLRLGFVHILPLGFDHILFVLSLVLLNPKLKPVLLQATTFTLAHSITLGLSMYHVISLPAGLIEPLIALSIVLVAIQNIWSSRLKASRVGIVFLFGLVHGMGFAGALGRLGLPPNDYLLSLVMFNVGVEFGQLTVILLAYFILLKWVNEKPYYRRGIVIPVSSLIAIIAGFWTIERLFL
jgi:HupE / UreJ protein